MNTEISHSSRKSNKLQVLKKLSWRKEEVALYANSPPSVFAELSAILRYQDFHLHQEVGY